MCLRPKYYPQYDSVCLHIGGELFYEEPMAKKIAAVGAYRAYIAQHGPVGINIPHIQSLLDTVPVPVPVSVMEVVDEVDVDTTLSTTLATTATTTATATECEESESVLSEEELIIRDCG